MALFKPANLNSQKSNGGAYGNTVTFANDVTPTAFTTTDVIQPLLIAAGTLITALSIDNDDLDSNGTPLATAKIGYVYADGTAAPAGADAIFGSGLTIFRATARTALQFKPFLVTKDIVVTIVPTANAATFAAGKISAIATGILTNAY